MLPWQWLALCWFAGIWGTRHPQPAIVVALAAMGMYLRWSMQGPSASPAVAADRPVQSIQAIPDTAGPQAGPASQNPGFSFASWARPMVPLLLALLAVAAGYGAAVLRTTDASELLPAFVEDRKPVVVTGTVQAVEPALNNRLQIILDDVWCDTGEEQVPLAGRMVWTWDSPEQVGGMGEAARPGPGQQVSLRQRVKPVRGFLNEGTWDSGQYWRDKGVLWRVWTRGKKNDLRISGVPSRIWQWREAVRMQVMGVLAPVQDALRVTAVQAGLDDPPGSAAAGSGSRSGSDNDDGLGDTDDDGTDDQTGFAMDSWRVLVPEKGNPASVIPALLFGDRFYLTYERMDQLSLAAVSHSLALSGMHLGVMAGSGWCLAWIAGWLWPGVYLRLPRPKLAVLLAAPLVAGYVWLGGGSPSLLRAALMFACWGVLLWRNRPRVLLDGVLIAVMLITLWDPLALFDLRLQLSALAVLSLALLLPVLLPVALDCAEWLCRKRNGAADAAASTGEGASAENPSRLVSRFISHVCMGAAGLLAANLSIQLGMLPVVLWNFNTTSSWFLLNLLWLPVLGFWVLPLCLAGLIFSAFWASAAALWFQAALVPVSWLFGGLDWLQQAGWLIPHVAMRPHWLSMAGYWLLLVCCAFRFGGVAERHKRLLKGGMAAGAVLLLLAPIGRMVTGMQDVVTLTLLDVGQGQSVLITLPHEQRILVDGGGFGLSGFDTGKSIVTPALTWHMPPSLALVANTHPDTDHLQGLFYPLRYFDVDRFVVNGDKPSRSNAARLREVEKGAGVKPETVAAGDVLFEREGLRLEVLHPPHDKGRASSNNAALVLRLVRNGHGLALLMGDLEKEGINALLASGRDLTAEVLVLPHHGAKSSLVPRLYDAVRPQIALAGTGYLNHWKFPSQAVRDELARQGIPLYHTAEHGQVRIAWHDDGAPQISSFLPAP
ncbi:MAG: DNA internalization-related competence protein ComEC/Rec2 [Halodesulfovibrio sp.]